jgi:hypothetical protein
VREGGSWRGPHREELERCDQHPHAELDPTCDHRPTQPVQAIARFVLRCGAALQALSACEALADMVRLLRLGATGRGAAGCGKARQGWQAKHERRSSQRSRRFVQPQRCDSLSAPMSDPTVCPACQQAFRPRAPHQRFCSPKCATRIRVRAFRRRRAAEPMRPEDLLLTLEPVTLADLAPPFPKQPPTIRP